jgi:amidase
VNIDEYTSYDGCGLAELVRSAQVSVSEVRAVALEAIERVQPKINAVAGEPFPDGLAYSDSGPLAGVPFAIKDLMCHAQGVPTWMGSRITGPDGITFTHDTELMARFRRAGLMTLARTTTPEMGYNANSEALVYGSTRNPYDLERSSGGSSGGSGALVASGAVPIAHANDGGGSIRIPAAYNGLVGLKPTRGRVSSAPDMQEALYGFAAEFVVTRTVRDTAAVLDAVAGSVPGDKFRVPSPARAFVEEIAADPGPLRVAVHSDSWAGSAVDPEVTAAVDKVAATLADLGHQVEKAGPVFDWDAFMLAHYRAWAGFVAESVHGVSELTGLSPGSETLEASVLAAYEYGRVLTVIEMAEASAIVNTISRTVGRFFTDYDVVLTPTANTPALPLGYLDANDEALGHEEWTRRIFDVVSFTPLFNLTGSPAMSLPLAVSSRGLPIGVQIATEHCAESRLIALAAQLERAMPWADRRPGVHATS